MEKKTYTLDKPPIKMIVEFNILNINLILFFKYNISRAETDKYICAFTLFNHISGTNVGHIITNTEAKNLCV